MKKLLSSIILSFLIFFNILNIAQSQESFYTWRQRISLDCKALTNGKKSDLCVEYLAGKTYACNPTNGITCSTPNEWVPVGGASNWGSIAGTLSDQTDLKTVLDSKLEALTGDVTTSGNVATIDSSIKSWINNSGNTSLTDDSNNVGIGTSEPIAKLDVRGLVHSTVGFSVNGVQACLGDGTNCNPTVFFNPANFGNATWGSGLAFDWTFDSGAIKPKWSFGSGTTTLDDTDLTIKGSKSQITFRQNNMFINGTTLRKLTIGSTLGTYNEDLTIDNDTANDTIALGSTTNANILDFGIFKIRTTAMSNWMGNVSIGTFTPPINTISAAGNVSVGTLYATNYVAPTNGALIQGNVGIGTFNPQTELQVNGTIQSTGIKIPTNAGSGYILTSNSVGVGTWMPASSGVTNNMSVTGWSLGNSTATTPSPGTNNTALATTAYVQTELVGITSGLGGWVDGGTNIYQVSTTDSVGIGTTTPGSKLDIRGGATKIWTGSGTNNNALSSGELYVEGDLEVDGTLYATVPTANTVITNANLTGEVTSVGNATTIGDSITVNGWDLGSSVATTPASNDNDTSIATTAFVNTLLSASAGGWTDGGTSVYQTTTTDKIGIGTTEPSTTLEIVKQGSNSPLMISNTATSDGDYLIVKSNGNVGINTIEPISKLQVNGTITATSIVSSLTGNASTTTFADAANDTTTWLALGTSQTGNLSLATDANLTYNASTNALTATTFVGNLSGNADTVTTNANLTGDVTSSGNTTTLSSLYKGWSDNSTHISPSTITDTISIGTTTPVGSAILTIANGLTRIGTGGTNTVATTSGELYVQGDIEFGGNISGSGAGLTNLLASGWEDTGPNVSTITTTDNVGIGTPLPTQKLEVVGTVKATAFVGDASGLTNIPGGSSGWQDDGTNVHPISLTDTIGIGTTNATSTLEIVKQGSVAPLMVSATGTGDGNYLIVKSDGNVGIGTTLPTVSFQVGNKLLTTNSGGNVGIGLGDTNAHTLSIQNGGPTWTANAINTGSTFSSPYLAANNNVTAWLFTGSHQNFSGSVQTVGLDVQQTSADIGTSTSGIGIRGSLINTDTTTTTPNIYGVVGTNTKNGAGGTVTNSYGLYGTSATVIAGTITNNYALGANGKSVFAGNVGIGTTLGDSYTTILPSNGGLNIYGNLGVGTWNPTNKLSVVGTVSATTFVGNGSGLTGIGGWTDGGTNIAPSTTTDTISIGTITPVSSAILTIAGDNVQIGSGGTNNNATNAGELYVQGDLEVDGTAYLSIAQVTDDAYAVGWNGSTEVPTKNAIYDKIETLGASSGGWTDGGTTVYVSTSTDNVGIGTTTATHALDVNGTVSATQFITTPSNTPATQFSPILSGDTNYVWGMNANGDNSSNDSLYLVEGTSITANRRIIVAPGGNIGIGSTTPTSKLSVDGTVTAAAFVGDGSGLTGISSGSGINWSAYSNITSLTNDDEFIVNDSGTSKAINWENIQQISGFDASTTFNIKQYGAKGDGITLYDGAITSGTPNFTSATANFTSADVGKVITIIGAGGTNIDLTTTISAYVSSTAVTLANNASATVSSAGFTFGTDDTTAINNAVSTVYASSKQGGTIFFPQGIYIVNGAFNQANNSQIGLPTVLDSTAKGQQPVIIFRGVYDTKNTSYNRIPTNGTIIYSTKQGTAGDSVISGKNVSSSGSFTHVQFEVHNMLFRTVQNPANSVLNLAFVNAARGSHVSCDTAGLNSANIPQPTGSSSYCLIPPGDLNNQTSDWEDVNSRGFYNGIGIGEHMKLRDSFVIYSVNGAVIQTMTHAAQVDYIGLEGNINNVVCGGAGTVNFTFVDIEHIGVANWYSTTTDIKDGSNLCFVHMKYDITGSGGAGQTLLLSSSVAKNWSVESLDGTNRQYRQAQTTGLWAVNTAANSTTSGAYVSVAQDTDAQVTAGTRLGGLGFWGAYQAGRLYSFAASITAFADESFTSSAAGSHLQFNTSPIGSSTPVERMRIMPNGNVGIGTSAPLGQFNVGTSYVRIGTGGTNTNATSAGELYVQGDLEVDGTIYGDGSGLTNITSANGWNDGGTNVYTSTTTDNVGIGTTTPSTTLEIVKQGSQKLLMLSGTPTGDGDYLTVRSDGNVGIGTIEPTTQLHIVGNLTTAGTVSKVSNTNTGGFAESFVTNSDGNGVGIISTSPSYSIPNTYGFLVSANEKLVFGENNGTINMVIDGNGNVGIGSTSPGSQLTISNGAAHAGQALCVTTAGRVGYCTTTVGAGGDCTCTAL